MKITRDCLVSPPSCACTTREGNLLEASDAPLVYLHGAPGHPAEDRAGARRTSRAGRAPALLLEPDDAFGDDDAALLQLVPVQQLGAAARVGMRFEGVPGQPADGRVYTVTQVADGMALLDANHPYAGWALRFDIEVLKVEAASREDLEGADAAVVPEFLRAVAGHDVHAEACGRKH